MRRQDRLFPKITLNNEPIVDCSSKRVQQQIGERAHSPRSAADSVSASATASMAAAPQRVGSNPGRDHWAGGDEADENEAAESTAPAPAPALIPRGWLDGVKWPLFFL